MERMAGIEPAASAWKAEVLPLYDIRVAQNIPWKEQILTSQILNLKMVEGGGFEPPKLSRQIYNLIPLAAREPLQI